MTYNDVKTIISKIKYKPGWKFMCKEKTGGYVEIFLEVFTLSSKNVYETVSFRNRRTSLLDDITSHSVLELIYQLVQDTENHEIKEWLKYGNKHFISPHKFNNIE